ncbi:MAG: tetratricopeptide repeat protein, partial [Cyanobacteria bacterium P01_A01_bin.17]
MRNHKIGPRYIDVLSNQPWAIVSFFLAPVLLPLLSYPLMSGVALARTTRTRADTALHQVNNCLQKVKTQQYSTALHTCKKARERARAAKNRQGEAKALLSLGLTYWSLSQYESAINAFEQALPLYQAIRDRNEEAKVLTNLGLVYRDLSQYERAITYYEQALPIFRTLEDRSGEAHVLGNLASAYWSLSDYEQVITIYKQVQSVFRELNDRSNEAKALWGLGITHWSLSQHEQAISYYEQALGLFRADKNRYGEATMLMGLGTAHGELAQHEQEIAFYEQALPIFQTLKNRRQEARVLNNLGTAYRSLSEYRQAIALFEEALPIFRELKGRDDEAKALTNLGLAYRSLSQPKRAISLFEEALPIFRTIKDRTGEGWVLSHLGNVHAQQNRPELAIVFYKQSVNVRETIRQGLQPLAAELQASYTDSISGTYRQLADLLLEQGRILEAQQVLELLKVQEIRDFNQDTRAGATVPGIPLSPTEAAILDKFDSLIVFGQTLEACRQSNCAQLEQLSNQRIELASEYNETIGQFRQELRGRPGDDRGFFDPELLGDAQEVVERTQAKTQAKTVLIYPLVLNKKLWLLWVAAGGVVKSQPVKVSQAELSQTVLSFRQQMKVCEARTCTKADTQRLKEISQELYDWLIRPVESELTRNNVQNLVFALDRTVRYVPMAALHDGQQYLVEKYT